MLVDVKMKTASGACWRVASKRFKVPAALTEKSVSDQPAQPDAIWLFRRAILDEWAARGDVALDVLVAHVMVHELAHHFGWSDADIATIDAWWT